MTLRRLAPYVVATLAVVAIGVAGVWLDRASTKRGGPQSLLYLPNGKYLKVASLGQASVLADAIYVWSIQFYSDYDRSDRYRYVEHVFGNVIAELDPNYIDPYWMGALILSVEAHDVEAALRLIDRGFSLNPQAWTLPWLAGWELYYLKRFDEASRYFALAAAVPEAPPIVLRMRAGMQGRAGDFRLALRMWVEILDDPRSDAGSRAVAERQIRSLRVRVDMDDLARAVARFREENRRNPARLEELVDRNYIASVPLGPDGAAYGYDPRTGRVQPVAGRVLGDF